MQFPPALREPQYRIYALGNFFSLQGVWAQRTLIAWLAWDLTESASWVGVVAFLSAAPTFVSGPIFGVLADRIDLKRAAMMTQAALAGVSAALLFALLTGQLGVVGLSVVALAQGVTISAHHPVRMALTPRLAPRAALPNAIAISSLNFNLARLTAPAWAGYGIAHAGVGWTVAATLVFFSPVLLILARLVPRAAEGAPARAAGIAAALTEGAAFAWSTPAIRLSLLLTSLFALVVRGYMELLPVMADGVFARGAAGLGELMAAAGAGALVAAVYLSSRDVVRDAAPPREALFALALGYAAIAGVAFAPVWGLTLALTALAGFCGTMVGVTMQSVVQLALDDGRRGRVMSLWIMVGIGAAALGAIGLGALIDLFGHRPALIGAAALAGVMTIGVFVSQGSSRKNAI